jgi:hypothetical protein
VAVDGRRQRPRHLHEAVFLTSNLTMRASGGGKKSMKENKTKLPIPPLFSECRWESIAVQKLPSKDVEYYWQ